MYLRKIIVASGITGGIIGSETGFREGIEVSLLWDKTSHKVAATTLLTMTGTAVGLVFGSMFPISIPAGLYYLYRRRN